MKINRTITPMEGNCRTAVALGYFDGIHEGHRQVLGAAVQYARLHPDAEAGAFTFSLPSRNSLKGGQILSVQEKHRRIASLGIVQYMEPPFEEFRGLSPELFVEKILVNCFRAKAVFCGDNFTFGAFASGDVAMLKRLCAKRDIEVYIIDMAQYHGGTVSSTRIRAALEEGRMEDANAMLGEAYSVAWTVTHGRHIGTSKLGTPTINQNYPAGMLMPCMGVYLTRIELNGKWYPSATGIGKRPTVEGGDAAETCETYVPDFSGDVYNENPRLEFYHYLCPVRKFGTMEELSALIRHAGEESKRYFAQKGE